MMGSDEVGVAFVDEDLFNNKCSDVPYQRIKRRRDNYRIDYLDKRFINEECLRKFEKEFK